MSVYSQGVPVQGPSPGPPQYGALFLGPLSVLGPSPGSGLLHGQTVQLRPHCTGTVLDMFKLVHYAACTIDKRAIGIRLKCLLVDLGLCSPTESDINYGW